MKSYPQGSTTDVDDIQNHQWKIQTHSCYQSQQEQQILRQALQSLHLQIKMKDQALYKANRLIKFQQIENKQLHQLISSQQKIIQSLSQELAYINDNPQIYTFQNTLQKLQNTINSNVNQSRAHKQIDYQQYIDKKNQRLSALNEKIKQIDEFQDQWNQKLNSITKNTISLKGKLFLKKQYAQQYKSPKHKTQIIPPFQHISHKPKSIYDSPTPSTSSKNKYLLYSKKQSLSAKSSKNYKNNTYSTSHNKSKKQFPSWILSKY